MDYPRAFCTPPTERHRFENDVCKFCGHKRSPEMRPLTMPLSEPEIVHVVSIKDTLNVRVNKPVDISAASIKLEHITKLMNSYVEAREELLNFLSQNKKEKVTFDDPIDSYVTVILDDLYKEFGRDVFWHGVKN